MLENKAYEDAIRELSRIPDYKDSRQLTLQCHYQIAADMEAVGDLTGAATEFLLAGDYKDAPDKNREMVYLQAEEALKKGKLEDAQALYASIPGYEDMEYTLAYGMLKQVPEGYLDADSLRIRAAYEAGKTARDNGDLETARELLEAAGKYKNAQRILNQVNAEIQKAQEAAEAAAQAAQAAQDVPEATEAPAAAPETPAPETPAAETPAEPAQDNEYAVKDGE